MITTPQRSRTSLSFFKSKSRSASLVPGAQTSAVPTPGKGLTDIHEGDEEEDAEGEEDVDDFGFGGRAGAGVHGGGCRLRGGFGRLDEGQVGVVFGAVHVEAVGGGGGRGGVEVAGCGRGEEGGVGVERANSHAGTRGQQVGFTACEFVNFMPILERKGKRVVKRENRGGDVTQERK